MDGMFRRPAGPLPVAAQAIGPVQLGFRPEHAELVGARAYGSLAGEVYVVELLGNETLVTVKVGDALVNVREPEFGRRSATAARAPARQRVHLFDAETGEALVHNAGTAQRRTPPNGAKGREEAT